MVVHHAGLHPSLVAFDVSRDDGMPVGRNRTGGQFAAPGATVDYTWYVGDIGGQPSADALGRLADEGYRTIVSTRGPGELSWATTP